jgi:hypothetical protein
MRSGFLFMAIVISAALCRAATLTDPFNQPQTGCDYSATSPYSSCDVIGNEQLYDIQMASVTVGGGLLTVMIYVNAGAVQKDNNNQLVLGSFSDSGLTLMPGDLLFYNPTTVYDPSDPNTAAYLQYGIPLVDHGSFVAGSLYGITGGTTVETAEQALNDSSDYYRRDEAVLMTGSATALTSGSVSVANYGDGTNSARYVITVTTPITSGFLSLVLNGQIGLLFSSADCGNDVIQGAVGTDAPEPSPVFLVLAGIGLLVAGCKWRKPAV